MLGVLNLKKKYSANNEYTLNDISYTFNDTGLYFIIGKSGSGKTTLLSLLGAMDYNYEGSIKFNNKEIKSLSEKEKEDYRLFNVSFAFQDFKAKENETVFENLKNCLFDTDINDDEIEKRIDLYLSKLNLLSKKNSLFKFLSGGEKKRISLIRALIKDSDILLLDEPLSSLNKEYRKQITSLLIEESNNKLVIVITHEKNEIPANSTTLYLIGGKLKTISENNKVNSKVNISKFKREAIKNIRLFSFINSIVKSDKKYISFSIFSLVIAFYSIIISLLLTITINNTILKTFNKYMDNNSLVIERKEDKYLSNNYENVSYNELYNLKLKYPTYIENIHFNYIDDIDSFFDKGDNISLNYENKLINLKDLNFKSMLNFLTFQEVNDSTNINLNMKKDEIALGLKDEYINLLSKMVFDFDFKFIDDGVELLNEYLSRINVFLNLNMRISKYNYYNNYSYKIIKVVRFNKNVIINNNEIFADYFINNVLHFESKHIDEESTSNFAINKTYGLRLYNDKKEEFFSSFIKDDIFNSYIIKINDDNSYFELKNNNTHNHYRVYKRFYDRLDYSFINEVISDFKEDIIAISYSTNLYTYTANSYMSGFKKPFFFSLDKSKLNEIEDEYYKSEENLGSFQSSSFKVDDSVIKSDLFESVNNSSLLFKSLDLKDYKLKEGGKLKSYSEVYISSGLQEKLFNNLNPIDKSLYILSLDNIKELTDGYENIFSQGEVTIKGVIEDENLAIYQDGLFPSIYAFKNTNIDVDELLISQAVINLSLKNNDKDYYLEILNSYSNLKGNFPMQEITSQVNQTIKYLAIAFICFSIVSFLLSFFLITMNTYLIFKRNQKQIGVYLALGYQKKDIEMIYFTFNVLNIIISYMMSLLLAILTEQIFKKTLKDIFLNYKFSFIPYLTSLLAGIFLIGCIFIYLKIILKNISPKDSFLKN